MICPGLMGFPPYGGGGVGVFFFLIFPQTVESITSTMLCVSRLKGVTIGYLTSQG